MNKYNLNNCYGLSLTLNSSNIFVFMLNQSVLHNELYYSIIFLEYSLNVIL